jgi:hypothetical protein
MASYSSNSSEFGFLPVYPNTTENGLNPADTVSTGYSAISTLTGAVTITPSQLVSGVISHDPNGGAVTATLPTAADLIQAMRSSAGTGFYVSYINTADAAETITVAAGTGMTLHGTFTIAQNKIRTLLVIQRNSTEVDVFSLGEINK